MKAARAGHVHAMHWLGNVHSERNEREQAEGWFTKAAEAGLPKAMVGRCMLAVSNPVLKAHTRVVSALETIIS